MHHQQAGHQPVPRPLILVAALLAMLGLLTMHTLMVLPVAANVAASPESGHTAHEHSHPDRQEVHHSHPSAALDTQLRPASGSGLSGHPCTSCPGCGHETISVCALTPTKAGTSSHLALSVSDLAPAPHQLTSWSVASSRPSEATPTPPSLITLSISRT